MLTAPDLVREKGKPADSVLFADGRITKDAKPGTYSISFTCAGKTVSNKFTVQTQPAPVQAKAQVPVKPKGAAETGDLTPAPTDDAPVPALVRARCGAEFARFPATPPPRPRSKALRRSAFRRSARGPR